MDAVAQGVRFVKKVVSVIDGQDRNHDSYTSTRSFSADPKNSFPDRREASPHPLQHRNACHDDNLPQGHEQWHTSVRGVRTDTVRTVESHTVIHTFSSQFPNAVTS